MALATALLALAWAFPSRPALAADPATEALIVPGRLEPCRFKDEEYYLPAAACHGAARARELFDKLTRAAGDSLGPIELRIEPNNVYVEARYDTDENGAFVAVSRGFLYHFADREPAMLFILAHELGHGVQDHAVGFDKLERAFGNRRLETQADLLGILLALRAGYPASTCVEGARAFFDWNAYHFPNTAAGGPTHPSNDERLGDIARNLDELVRRAASAAWFDPQFGLSP